MKYIQLFREESESEVENLEIRRPELEIKEKMLNNQNTLLFTKLSYASLFEYPQTLIAVVLIVVKLFTFLIISRHHGVRSGRNLVESFLQTSRNCLNQTLEIKSQENLIIHGQRAVEKPITLNNSFHVNAELKDTEFNMMFAIQARSSFGDIERPHLGRI